MYRLFALFLLCICLINSHGVSGWQPADSLAVSKPGDTVLSPFVRKVLQAADHDERKSRATYEAGKIAIKQRVVWAALTRAAQEVKLYLDKGLNLSEIKRSLKSVKASYEVVQ